MTKEERSCFGDARHLPFEVGAFDVVFSYSVLQHFSETDLEDTLRHIARVTKPGGTDLVQMANRLSLRNLQQQFRRRFRQADGFEVRYRTAAELKGLFTRLIGNTDVFIDGFFGLNVQSSDRACMPLGHRLVIRARESLKRVSQSAPWLTGFADSVYLCSQR
jgi:SAM-dependent methyltransferase